MKLLALTTTALFLSLPVQAVSLSPPEPVQLPFAPGRSDLHEAVRDAVDRLAVRALSCLAKGPLQITLAHHPSADQALVRRRSTSVRERFRELGLLSEIRAREAGPGEEADDGLKQWQALSPSALAGSVQVEGEHCYESNESNWGVVGPRLRDWQLQLERSMSTKPPSLPAFWARLPPGLRREYLSLALAEVSYERQSTGSVAARRVYWWLVQNEALNLPPARRLWWGLDAWAVASDADLAEVKRRLALGDLPVEERVAMAPWLARSSLPWSVIERRLMADGVLAQAMVQLPPNVIDRSDDWLFDALARRGQWGRLSRMALDSGAGRACLVEAAMTYLQPDLPAHQRAMAQLPTWVKGHVPRFQHLSGRCDPSERLLAMGTGCNAQWGHPDIQSQRAARWLRAGFVLDPAVVAIALSSEGTDSGCRIERASDGPFPYRTR